MEIGDTKIPDEMLEIANNEFFKAASLNGLPNRTDGERLGFALAAAVRWLRDDLLHERSVDFHRAILSAGRERFPGDDQDTAVIMRRVDLEYGVSFARNYIRRLFSIQKDEPMDDFAHIFRFSAILERPATAKDEPVSEREKQLGIREHVVCVRAEDYDRILAAYQERKSSSWL